METEETGIDPAQTAEPAEPVAAPEPVETPAPDAGAEPPKEPKGVQKRIDELVRQREEERRRAEKLETMLHEMYTRQQQPQPAQPVQTADAPPKAEDFGDYDEFLRATARFEAKQELRAETQRMEQIRKQAEVQQRQQTYQQRVGGIIEKGKTTHEDFDLVAMNPSVAISDYVLAAAAESEVGHEILYHLGKYPEEARRIAELSPYAQAREVGKIEAKITAPIPKATTQAPPPVNPVGGNAGADAEPDPAKDPVGWSKWERARVQKLGRRY